MLGISTDDFWWHIKIGEYILNNGIVPDIAIGNWYAECMEIPWFAHEWLSEVLLYFIVAT